MPDRPPPVSLSLVVPAFNEEASLRATVEEARRLLASRLGDRCATEWVLVDDGSTDRTWAIAQELAEELPSAVAVRHGENKGLGIAIWTGVQSAGGEWVSWLPADGQFSAEGVAALVDRLPNHDLGLVMREDRRGLGRRLLSLGVAGLTRLMVGASVHGFSGIFLARRSFLLDVPRVTGGSAVQNYAVVLHGHDRGLRIDYVPVVVLPRRSGSSRFSTAKSVFRTARDLWRLRRQLD